MYGNITMSRMGIMGSLRGSFFSRGVVVIKKPLDPLDVMAGDRSQAALTCL